VKHISQILAPYMVVGSANRQLEFELLTPEERLRERILDRVHQPELWTVAGSAVPQ
jgi:hypothetical protein